MAWQLSPAPVRWVGKENPNSSLSSHAPEQTGLVEDIPAHGSGLEIDDFQGSFQSKPFYDSMGFFPSTVSFK